MSTNHSQLSKDVKDKDIFKESNHINSESSSDQNKSINNEIFNKQSLKKPTNLSNNNIQFPELFNNTSLHKKCSNKDEDSSIININESIYVEKLSDLYSKIRDTRMYAFKQTLNLCKDLNLFLTEALSNDQFLHNLDQFQSSELVTLLRELLHQMFLEGDDFIASYLDECM